MQKKLSTPAAPDRRSVSRHRSLLKGLAYFGNSPSAIDCFVRDISDFGARLNFAGVPPVANSLKLHIPAKGQTLHARVRWQQTNEIGVVFEQPASNAPIEGSELSDRVAMLEDDIAALKKIVRRLQQELGAKSEV